MTIAQLRFEVSQFNLRPLRRLRDDALALIDLQLEYRGEASGDVEELATSLCEWGLACGLIFEKEYGYLHGMMTMHVRPSLTDAPPPVDFSTIRLTQL